MDIKSGHVLSKTLKGIDAARSGAGISATLHSVLKLVDGTKSAADLIAAAKGAGVSEADCQKAMTELQKSALVRVVERAAGGAAGDSASADAENQLLLTRDFTKQTHDHQKKAAAASATAATGGSAAMGAAPSGAQADHEARAREARAARLKIESEVRQKLVTALQPRIEEELRKRLRPKLEEELRPKLIAALRPGLEAEVRTALVKELTPRIELELKTRFAKSLAEQKAADEQASREQVQATPAPVAAPADSGFERVLASMSLPVFSVDKTGVCTYMSPAWAQFSGFTADETVGKHLSDFFSDGNRRAITAMLVGICNGTALRFDQQGALLRKGGEPLWVEINASPLYSSSGEPGGVCGSLRDASETRRIAEQAEADGVRLLLLVDQIDTGVLLEDGEGNIQQINPAFCALLSLADAPYSLEGLPVSELLEKVSEGFIGPEGFLRRISDMRTAGADVKGESFILADGRVMELDYLAVTVGDEAVGRVWLFREVRRRAERPARPAFPANNEASAA